LNAQREQSEQGDQAERGDTKGKRHFDKGESREKMNSSAHRL
jgi:hypothetical protein